MKTVYLDNAASTPLIPEVIEAMTTSMQNCYGNPSSIHRQGRTARTYIEDARKRVAHHLQSSIGEIFFTSGGTESNNTAIKRAVHDLGVTRIISSEIEHKCVLNAVKRMGRLPDVTVDYVALNDEGEINYEHLETLLKEDKGVTLVSIIHAHNELGTLNDLRRISDLCKTYNAYLHSDTVQTICHIPLSVEDIKIDFLSASAHKFHGPKGVGFLYINGDNSIEPMLDGGGQERNMRAGTENVAGILGLAAAMDHCIERLENMKSHILSLRAHMKSRLQQEIPGVAFNGAQDDNFLYTILNVAFPSGSKTELLSFNMDIAGICASGGSACTSGTEQISYVLETLNLRPEYTSIRFSFSHLTTMEDIDYAVDSLTKILVGKQ